MKKFFLSCLVICFLVCEGYSENYCPPSTMVSIEALYWKANVDGMEYALFDRAFFDPIFGNYATDFQLKEAKLLPAWGFKLGIDRILRCGDWIVGALWSRFNSHGSGSISRTETNAGIGFQGNDANDLWLLSGTNAPQAIQGTNKFRYDTLDITLNRPFYFCGPVEVNLLFGVKGANILEHLKVKYIGTGVAINGLLYGGINPTVFIHNDFIGIGPLIGVNSYFPIGWGFSLNGMGCISTLWGEFNLNQKENATPDITITAKRRIKRIQSDLNLGIDLNWYYCAACWSLLFKVGYEINYWINFIRQNKYSDFGPNLGVGSATSPRKSIDQRHGDLTLHGLKLSLTIGF